MRLLFIHADRIEYKVGRKTPIAEPLDDEHKEDSMSDCIVVYASVEKIDESMPSEIVEMMETEILSASKTLKTKNVMIFPFAHLSQSLSSPKIALDILNQIEKKLVENGLNVKRVPFGWYKKFKLESKGHPMAVASRSLCPKMKNCKLRCPHCDNPIPEKTT